MKKLAFPVLGLALMAFASPALAGSGCGWDKHTSEKPEEKVENPSA